MRRAAALAAVLAASVARAAGPAITHGVTVGEVGATGARVWARCATPGRLVVARDGAPPVTAAVDASGDQAATVTLTGLTAATPHLLRVHCEDARGRSGRVVVRPFTTAPEATASQRVRLAWLGDLGGQNVCADRARGYPALEAVAAERPDVVVGLGDMIYADDACLARGRYGNAQRPGPPPATDLDGFRAHWRYNLDDPHLQRLRGAAAWIAVQDDHDIADDADAGHPLLADATRAAADWNPQPADTPWRSARWGRHLELFVLDLRSQRAPNTTPPPASMLGAAQRAWLARAVAASDATWKVVVSSVPIAVPTGRDGARDGWAGGAFQPELLSLLGGWKDARVRNLVWITTDIHFATVLRHRPFADDVSFTVLELASGPITAGIFPRDALDETTRPERLFFLGPASPDAVRSFDEAMRWFNFGILDVDAGGRLAAEIIDGTGATRWALALEPVCSRCSR
ncbi:MAG: alkaline phosphatase D family protein [bacterium]|nr:alkaline phosphatase D family protein [bacterium]